ncbi:hypothetical protein EW026_g7213 [Hermanssonia centrifuga]|uniref:C2H2-type domain-containing protein n=1 Tax=Hermanssonia centrifuga TaxID=98765 RepID=A0A4S4K9M0_9APHY|nr:hypothetical protein EW026_g7213 [Hermanssonia centrifuga]
MHICRQLFTNNSGLKRHVSSAHQAFGAGLSRQPPPAGTPVFSDPGPNVTAGLADSPDLNQTETDGGSDESQDPSLAQTEADGDQIGGGHGGKGGKRVEIHSLLDGTPCDLDGNDLPPNTPPLPRPQASVNNYSPFTDRSEFELADFFYRKVQMSGGRIDELMQLWGSRDRDPPFADHNDLYNCIDAISVGEIPWQTFSVSYKGARSVNAAGEVPGWMDAKYEVHFWCPRTILQNQIGNPDFAGEIDFAPKRVFGKGGKRQYCDFMSGNWAWNQADIIATNDASTHGATFCPIIAGSDKTTVSVATGQNEYYPLYISNGLVHNNVCRAHRNAVTLVAFLAVPKTDPMVITEGSYMVLGHTSLIIQSKSYFPVWYKAGVQNVPS